MNDEIAARRPLKSRSNPLAGKLSRGLLRCHIRPNQVSTASVAFAMITAGSLWSIHHGWTSSWAWLLAAVGIQGRLLCNLMDGMLAIEGGLKTPNGDLYNEVPDRLADILILASLGYAGATDLSVALGWLAACGAVMTAYVRMHGASLTDVHDFRGPMAKPHRMALATGVCGVMAVFTAMKSTFNIVPWALALMVLGIVITLMRRLSGLSQALHRKASSTSAPS
jgi:phosphatidylglycerophosphate synthase